MGVNNLISMDQLENIQNSLTSLMKNWKIEKPIYDLHLGTRNDVVDHPVNVNGVVFHIPLLENDKMFVLWKCLWPDCHNCCERQGRLPLTKDDIKTIAKKLGYSSNHDFLTNETRISSWTESDTVNNVISTISMISLKRKIDEGDNLDGIPVTCRFLDGEGYCKIHPEKPGVCWLYPFASWMENKSTQIVIHASFQLTGDCPGFYTSKTIDPMMEILKEYSKKIYDYNMSISRTTRENYGFINLTQLKP